MRTLFIDVGSHQGCIACVTEKKVMQFTEIDHRIDDASLMELIQETLKKATWTLKDLTGIACVVGPGGFTSLRVGVATTNALSWSLEIPSAGIHLSDLWRARTQSSPAVWLHSTKKKEVFLRMSGPDASDEAHCVQVDQLPSLLKGITRWTGELIAEHEVIVTELGLTPATAVPLQKILPEFLSLQNFGSQTLLPWYGRGW